MRVDNRPACLAVPTREPSAAKSKVRRVQAAFASARDPAPLTSTSKTRLCTMAKVVSRYTVGEGGSERAGGLGVD